jgi:hypothetical protein
LDAFVKGLGPGQVIFSLGNSRFLFIYFLIVKIVGNQVVASQIMGELKLGLSIERAKEVRLQIYEATNLVLPGDKSVPGMDAIDSDSQSTILIPTSL